MGLSSGEVLEEFEIEHRIEGFQEFFSRIEKHRKKKTYSVAVSMEGYNGYARPLDSMVREQGYRLYNLPISAPGRPLAGRSRGHRRSCENFSYSLFQPSRV
jgi:hypothetical protein